MRRLVVAAFVTLDGVMQAPGGPEEDPTGGFAQGGWSVPYWDDTMNESMSAVFADPFALLLGRRTYEIFAAHWPHVDEAARAERGGTASEVDDPAASALNTATKYVASRTLTEVTWQNSELLEGDAAGAVAALKEEDGPDLLTQGSSDLIQTLLTADLVDEIRPWTFPVLVGPGKRLFGSHSLAAGFELAEARTSTTGVVMATYRRAGDVQRGSFAFDDPTEEEAARRRKLAEEDRAS
jgi:dihydrofolate reductase